MNYFVSFSALGLAVGLGIGALAEVAKKTIGINGTAGEKHSAEPNL